MRNCRNNITILSKMSATQHLTDLSKNHALLLLYTLPWFVEKSPVFVEDIPLLSKIISNNTRICRRTIP